MGKVFLLTSFAIITPIVILLNIVFLSYLSFQKSETPLLSFTSLPSQTVAYAALPTIQTLAQGDITEIDARVEIVRQFFAKYQSPLEPHAKDVVFYADLYELDFRFIPAIAMQESNLCKKIPEGSNNCWGYGIHGSKVKKFKDYEEGIETVTKTLATVYKQKGLESPEEIMSRYTPSSDGSWARSVTHFMEQLQ